VERNRGQLPAWCHLPVDPQAVSHDEFKRLTQQARVMVRTGECTPYANVILVAGVTF
jgi:D-ribose pyranase